MRVQFITANYPPSFGGAQLFIQRIAEGLVADHGWDVEVITTDALRSPGKADAGWVGPPRELLGGVAVERLPTMRRTHQVFLAIRRGLRRAGLRRVSRLLKLPAIGPYGVRMLLAALRGARQADVLVGVGASFSTIPMTRLVARWTATPYVALPLLHLTTPFPALPGSVRAIGRAGATVTFTDVEKDWLVAKGVPADQIAVEPLGCDPDDFEAVDPRVARTALGMPDSPTVGYIGRLASHKGIDTLAAAMEQIWQDRPEVRLLLAGSPAGWSEYDSVVERLEACGKGRVTLVKDFSDADKPGLFSSCDVIAFPSREESFGIVTLESWCAWRPPVVGDIDVARSIVRDGVDGVLAPVDDPAAWADALVSMLDDPATAAALGREGHRRIDSEFRWSVVVERWNDILASVAADRSRGR